MRIGILRLPPKRRFDVVQFSVPFVLWYFGLMSSSFVRHLKGKLLHDSPSLNHFWAILPGTDRLAGISRWR